MILGFNRLKNSLILLNIAYVALGVILIYSIVTDKLPSPYADYPPLQIGVQICGPILISLAIFGIYGARKHNQVVLFFYMVILFLLLIIQFVVCYTNLRMSDDHLQQLALKTWTTMDDNRRNHFMKDNQCCSFDQESACVNLSCCTNDIDSICKCSSCAAKLRNGFNYMMRSVRQIDMCFSVTEILGIWLTNRYRNLKDPRSNLNNAFL